LEIREFLITAAIYLKGDGLDPEVISALLKASPSISQRLGDKHVTSTGRVFVRKTGLWALKSSSESKLLTDHVNQVLEMAETILSWVDSNRLPITDLPGVEEAYFDIFMCGTASKTDEADCYFEISDVQASILARLRLPIHFTVGYVRED
jgi:hypothetical protein